MRSQTPPTRSLSQCFSMQRQLCISFHHTLPWNSYIYSLCHGCDYTVHSWFLCRHFSKNIPLYVMGFSEESQNSTGIYVVAPTAYGVQDNNVTSWKGRAVAHPYYFYWVSKQHGWMRSHTHDTWKGTGNSVPTTYGMQFSLFNSKTMHVCSHPWDNYGIQDFLSEVWVCSHPQYMHIYLVMYPAELCCLFTLGFIDKNAPLFLFNTCSDA